MKYLLTMAIPCFLLLAGIPAALADPMENAETYFQQGLMAYENDDYENAVTSLEAATGLDPSNSHYFHYLGKSYGKLANESNWFKAIDLSKKTLTALEQAVQLDQNNRKAVIDLIKFYRQAPGFLGGDNKKAVELEKQLAARETASSIAKTAHQ